jgi:osmotically inducible protein OsmC
MPTVRRAEVDWIGGFIDGEGTIVSTTTGALPELGVTWQARVDEDQSLTSPEELLAAAHASCFAMQFTSGLVGAGWEPEEMHVTCDVSFEIGLGITESALTARVTVPGLTDEQIYEIAQRAKIMCPLSRALAGIDITLDLPDLVLEDEEDEEDEEAAGAEGEISTARDE